MRWIIIIIALTGIAVGVLQLRSAELRMRHDIQVERAEQVRLQRTLWDQQVALSELTSPQNAQQLVEAMGLALVEKGNIAGSVHTPHYASNTGR
jgi:hypothetical protein